MTFVSKTIKTLIDALPFNNVLRLRLLDPVYLRWLRFKAEILGIDFVHWEQEGIESISARWRDRHIARNEFICCSIASLKPESALEIGASCGHVLSLLERRLPTARLVGLDINARAIEYGVAKLREEKASNITLQVGSAQSLSRFGDKSFDIVFSSAALMYVKPREILDVLRNTLRIASTAIVLMEMNSPAERKFLGEFYPPNNWKRNYPLIFAKLGVSHDRIKVVSLSSELWQPGGGGAAYIEIDVR